MKIAYQRREPAIDHGPRAINIQVAEPATQDQADRNRDKRPPALILLAKKSVDNMQIRQGRETATGNIHTGNATADDTEENEPIDCVRQAPDIGALERNHERTAQGSTTIDEIRVVVGNAHADEPDVDDEEGEHAPEDRADGLLDCVAGVGDLARYDCDMFAWNVSKLTI